MQDPRVGEALPTKAGPGEVDSQYFVIVFVVIGIDEAVMSSVCGCIYIVIIVVMINEAVMSSVVFIEIILESSKQSILYKFVSCYKISKLMIINNLYCYLCS